MNNSDINQSRIITRLGGRNMPWYRYKTPPDWKFWIVLTITVVVLLILLSLTYFDSRTISTRTNRSSFTPLDQEP